MQHYSVIFIILCTLYQHQVCSNSSGSKSHHHHYETTPLQDECLKQLNLNNDKDREALLQLNNRPICPEDNHRYNEFISCFWKKTGRQNVNGDINYEKLKEFVEVGIIQGLGHGSEVEQFAAKQGDKIINACKEIEESNKEIKVVKVRNCIVAGLNAL